MQMHERFQVSIESSFHLEGYICQTFLKIMASEGHTPNSSKLIACIFTDLIVNKF